MSKKLNIAMIGENVKKYDEKEKITLSDGNYTYIFPHFAPSKISEVIKETLTDFDKAKKANLDFSKINTSDWLFFNIIRYFCDLNIPNDIKKKAQIFVKLVDSDYFTEIIAAFPEESLNRLTEALNTTNKNLELLGKSQLNEQTMNKVVEESVQSTETESKPLQ